MKRSGVTAALVQVFLALALYLMLPAMAHADTRIALVIGNASYGTGKLANPRRDAELMAKALKNVGFDVTLVLDADRETMRKTVLAFSRRLRAAEGAVGIFYFAGHGVQVGGQNFLLAVDADVASEGEVALQGQNLAELLSSLKSSSERVTIAILDACRNNPFGSQARGVVAGLAHIAAPAGTLIAYATAPGEVALDGDAGNSPYTSALARFIPTPGLAVEDVFKRTREQVLKVTNGRQTPWEHSSLVGSFVFRPRAAEPETAEGAGIDRDTARRLAELKAWELIKDRTDSDAFRRHIATYPGGAFEQLAAFKIDLIARQPTGWSTIFQTAPTPPRGRSDAERAYEQAIAREGAVGPGRRLTAEQAAEVYALYLRAAEYGLVPAMYAVGRARERGEGAPRDEKAAADWFMRAIDGGSVPAMSALGTLHEYGRGVPKDLAQAVRLYRLAAEAKDAHGMACYAYLLAEGKGLARNEAEAREWYGRAAELGNPRAMFNLALMLMRKRGGPRDSQGAIELFRAAGARSHTASLRELAAIYDEGREAPRDTGVAVGLILEAARSQPGVSVLKARGEPWSTATRLELQRRLQVAGLYQGRVSGALDTATLQALLEYGKRADDPVATGAVGTTGSTGAPPKPFASGVIRSRLGVAALP